MPGGGAGGQNLGLRSVLFTMLMFLLSLSPYLSKRLRNVFMFR